MDTSCTSDGGRSIRRSRPAKAGIDPLIKLIDRIADAGGSPIGEAEPGPAGYRPDGSCYTGSDFIAFWGI